MSMKVLIADRDWRFAKTAALFLESRAHMVAHYLEPEKAAEAAKKWQVDLAIISDELAETGLLAELNALPQRPAILLTGGMDRYDRLWRAWQQGGDELLVKPMFRIEELQAAIVTALENAVAGTPRKVAAVSA